MFEFTGLPPGKYRVFASPPAHLPQYLGFSYGASRPNSPFSLDEGQAIPVADAESFAKAIIALPRGAVLTGRVTDRPAARVNGQLVRRTAGSNLHGHGFSTDEQGRFQMRNVPPGNYRLVARQMQRNQGSDDPQSDPGEVGSLPLAVTADLDNIVVGTSPGATVVSEVVFEDGPPERVSPIRVFVRPGNPDEDMGFRGGQPILVGPDRRFTVKGVTGESVLAVGASDLYVKSITVGAEDITDTPRDFKPADRVVITLTSRASTLEGTVTDGSGRSLSAAAVILFPEEKAAWRASSTRTRGGPVDSAGGFQVPGLMPGRYLVVALPRERLTVVSGGRDFAFYEELSKVAIAVVIGEHERRRVELRVVEGSGG